MTKINEDGWQDDRDNGRMRKTAAQSSDGSCAARRGRGFAQMQIENDTLELAVFQ